ncbi:MAG: endolytic transglycosylase MltG [Erysipelotrichaceae bacterium]|nr:endolytic transglycosylase MltG [Erysipelotrichaceae bacterium]
MKKSTKLLITVLVLLLLVAAGAFFVLKTSLSPVSKDPESVQTITIEDNWYGKKVLSYLEDEGIIKSADIAYLYTKLKKIDINFMAGTYDVSPSWTIEELIDYLSDGNNAIQDTVTIKLIEGNRLKEFANIIAKDTNLNAEELLAYWNDENVVRKFMKDYPFLTEDVLNEDSTMYLEGYLFPDTYEFFANTDCEEVTRKILDNTLVYYNKYKSAIEASELSVHEIFTLASIVQRESGNPDDMKDVASVFYNRMNAGMQLQSSVTVCYVLDIGLSEDWTKCEITQTEFNPYNTYQVFGLPPGAICAFNEYALDAVLDPNETEYYFFIGDVCGTGETIFAKTYAEQLENQEKYLTCY